MTTGAPPPAAIASPATIAPTQTTLSQPAGDSPPLAPAQTSAPANPVGVRLMRPTL